MAEADIGLIGLAVMGQNLALNMNDHGYRVAVFNRTVSKVDNFLEGPAKGSNIIGIHSLEEFIRHLKTPRRIMLMVKADKPVDVFIEQCFQFVQPGDLIIDGWDLDYGKIAMMWREGCIIRSRFLENIKDAYSKRLTS